MARVAVVNPVGGEAFGGAERVLVNLLAHLDRQQYEPCVIAATPGRFSQAASALGVDVEYIPLLRTAAAMRSTVADYGAFFVRALLGVPALVRKLKRRRADLLHTNSRGGHITGGLAGKMMGLPVVMHFQDHPAHPGPYRLLTSTCAQAIVVASQATGDWLRQSASEGWMAHKLRVIHAGVDVAEFHPQVSGERVRSELRLGGRFPVLLTVGSLEHRKGHLDLVSAAAIVRKTCPRLRVLIAGEEFEPGVFRPVLSEHIARLGMEDHVLLLGRREDVAELLAACDVFVLASLRDPYPTAVLEAMAVGRPVVTTRAGGSAEVVVDGETGLLVPPGQPGALAQAILTLVADPDRMQAMGLAGRVRVEQRASLAFFARSMERVYQQVLEQGKR